MKHMLNECPYPIVRRIDPKKNIINTSKKIYIRNLPDTEKNITSPTRVSEATITPSNSFI